MKPLLPRNLQLSGTFINRLEAKIPPGTSPDDVKNPEFWVHNLNRKRLFLPYTEIICFAENNSFELTLRVLKSEDGKVLTRVISEHIWDDQMAYQRAADDPQKDAKAAASADAMSKKLLKSGPRIDYVPGYGWRFINEAGQVLKDNMATKEEAKDFMRDHLLVLAAAKKAEAA